MSERDVKIKILSTLSAIAATEDGCPESSLYLALGSEMRTWEMVRGVLSDMKFITVKGNYVRLTEAGKVMAAKIDAAFVAKPA